MVGLVVSERHTFVIHLVISFDVIGGKYEENEILRVSLDDTYSAEVCSISLSSVEDTFWSETDQSPIGLKLCISLVGFERVK